jgi:hypothetical protein
LGSDVSLPNIRTSYLHIVTSAFNRTTCDKHTLRQSPLLREPPAVRQACYPQLLYPNQAGARPSSTSNCAH